jgi:hypothetical protein
MRNFILILLISFSSPLFSQTDYSELTWPREIETKNAILTLYQPQLELFEGNNLEARMAVSISENDEMTFGAVWIKSLISTDLDGRVVIFESVKVPKIIFPDLEDEVKIDKLSAFLEKEIESWNIEMSLDRLIASMDDIEDKKNNAVQLNNTPPTIYYRTAPSLLISIDGDPIYKEDEEFKLEYVVNTSFFIVKVDNKFYIKDGKFWYASTTVLKDYKVLDKAPKNVADFADKYGSDIELDSIQLAQKEAPDLIISTKASELIATDGDPDYQSIEGTELLYAANTEDDIIMDINSQEHYILLAGRWYHSKTLKDGDWKFTEPEDLPEDFANIPVESDLANVRSSVPNTPEAQDALLEQSIPQTAKVDRKTASVEVTYDGEPKFETITGTTMFYAVNTDKTVLLIDKKYYCVDDAIWFVSSKASGPWEVSVERPDQVDEIPPESPVYNVKYVYVYDSTPEIVYVGYYPGYTYSYVYGGVVVYGTGYYYPYWYGHYYYPRPVTYGYGVHYNPYTGWGFTIGISIGWHHHHHHGYWGAGGYHHGYRRGYHHGYNRGYNQGAKAGYAAGRRSSYNNVYANRTKGVKQTGNVNRTRPTNSVNNSKTRPSTKQNNMYTNKQGQVYQQKKDGSFENKSNSRQAATNNKASTGSKANNRASTGSKTNNNASTRNQSSQSRNQQSTSKSQSQQQQLNKASQNRSRGTQNYNRSTQNRSSGGSRRSGASRSGGGGRRR